MSNLLNTSSVLMCPHGGTVSAVTTNARAKAGDYLVRVTDTFTVAGCPFVLPGVGPHPCVSVKWIKGTTRCKVSGDFLLNQDSTGLCLAADQAPQGSVLIQSTQARASGT